MSNFTYMELLDHSQDAHYMVKPMGAVSVSTTRNTVMSTQKFIDELSQKGDKKPVAISYISSKLNPTVTRNKRIR